MTAKKSTQLIKLFLLTFISLNFFTPIDNIYGQSPTPAQELVGVEAENYAPSSYFENIHAGFTGTGYVNFPSVGGSFSFPILIPSNGTYPMSVRYSFAFTDPDRQLDVFVDGVEIFSDWRFPTTLAWSNWAYQTIDIPLTAGSHQIKLATSQNELNNDGPNIDHILIEGGGAIPTSTPSQTNTPTTINTSTPTPANCNQNSNGNTGNDGIVDLLDYGTWLNSYRTNPGANTHTLGNFNCKDGVDLVDYGIWLNAYRDGNPNITSSATPTTTLAFCGDNMCNGSESCSSCPADCGTCSSGGYEKTFTTHNNDIANPERGFMKQANIWVDQSFNASKISAKDPTDTLVWVYFHLENYRDPRDGPGVVLSDYQGIPLEPVGSGKGLDIIKKTFDEARKQDKNLKLVIRFLYVGYSGIGSTSNFASAQPDGPIELVRQHSAQLKPLLEENTDVIAAVQTGFVGYWGEWHSSKYLHPLDKRKEVIDEVLTMTPSDRMTQLRYPMYKEFSYGGQLTENQAFNQSPIARIGHHNDAFVRDDTDGGTFKSRLQGQDVTNYCNNYPEGEIQCWKDFINQDARFVPVGGETGTHSSTPSQYADCSNAVPMLNHMHWSFIHNGYSEVTLGHWVNQGCMPDIRRKLGHRLSLNKATLPSSLSPGNGFNFSFEIKNEGFAAMYNPRPVYVVIKNSNNRHEILLDNVDPRKWESGQTYTINKTITIPSNMPAGTYDIALWFPDPYESIKQRAEYAVQLANTNVWEASTGLNILANNLQITN